VARAIEVLRNSGIGGPYGVALGYLEHDASVVNLYLEETLAFEVLTPEAVVRVASS
jgi:uncharacterized linocin/CFP29 family protein